MRSVAKGRAGGAGAGEEQISVVLGPLGGRGSHRILVSGNSKASFSGLTPAQGTGRWSPLVKGRTLPSSV